MKAKKHIIVVLLGLMGLTAVAQQKKYKCDEAFAAFEVKINAGDYVAAFNDMPELRKNCRGFNEKLYQYGETVLKSKIENTTAEEKKILVNDLSALYSEYGKYYPQSDASIKKAMFLYDNKLATTEEVYQLLDAAFASKKLYFNDPNALETYFLLYIEKYKGKQEDISQDQFIEKYAAVSSQVRSASDRLAATQQEILKKQETTALTDTEKITLLNAVSGIETLVAVKENADILASKYLSCDKLSAYYGGQYEAQRSDSGWISAMVSTLLNNKCYNSEVLLKGALAVHQLRPTTQTAYDVAIIYQRRNDIKQAASYFEQAAQLETNTLKKADLYYRIASVFRNTDKAEAKKFVLQAAQLNPASGKPYIFLAEMYASVTKECGLTPFEQKALMWAAIETVKKAEVAEAKYKTTVASIIEGYNKRVPTKADVSAARKRKGDKITYGCWINETVTIPNIK